jgi:hypothetical protein
MAYDISKMFAEFRFDVLPAFIVAILVMEIAGPILTQWGLRMAGESIDDPDATIAPRSRLA